MLQKFDDFSKLNEARVLKPEYTKKQVNDMLCSAKTPAELKTAIVDAYNGDSTAELGEFFSGLVGDATYIKDIHAAIQRMLDRFPDGMF
jgi:hypothetical protein